MSRSSRARKKRKERGGKALRVYFDANLVIAGSRGVVEAVAAFRTVREARGVILASDFVRVETLPHPLREGHPG